MNNLQLPSSLESSTPLTPKADAWRPIHYLGSKLRIVGPIQKAIDQADPHGGRVCDLFSGSGTVASALSSSRAVTAVDIQEYSRVLCSAVLRPPRLSKLRVTNFADEAFATADRRRFEIAGLFEYENYAIHRARVGDFEPLCELTEHASLLAFQSQRPTVTASFTRAHDHTFKTLLETGLWHSRQTMITRYFGGLYFSYQQASDLDALLSTAHEIEDDRVRDCFLAAVISTASEVVNTVGKHFAQPIKARDVTGKPKRHVIKKILRDRSLDVRPVFLVWADRYRRHSTSKNQHRVFRDDYHHALNYLCSDVDVVYADPPYTRDHYSRFYHVLETMCRWDEPEVSTTRIRSSTEVLSRGMYRAERYQSPFCIKSQAPGALERLFMAVRDMQVPLVLSYSPYQSESKSHPRVMTVEQILSLAKKYFNTAEALSVGRFSHMKLNASHLHIDASTEAELLFICK